MFPQLLVEPIIKVIFFLILAVTDNDILLNSHAEQKPDVGINVQLNTRNG